MSRLTLYVNNALESSVLMNSVLWHNFHSAFHESASVGYKEKKRYKLLPQIASLSAENSKKGQNFDTAAQQIIFVASTANSINFNKCTRVGTLIVATIYLQLIQNRYVFRSFTVLQCSHQHCVQPVASDVEVVGYL